jgi:hypothetical protein
MATAEITLCGGQSFASRATSSSSRSAKLALNAGWFGFRAQNSLGKRRVQNRVLCCKFLDLCKSFESHEPSSGANRQDIE